MITKSNTGFTLIELLVVVSITILMSSVMFFDFRLGEQNSLVRSAAYQLAQDIRVVQEKAMSSLELINPPDTFLGGYGIYFEENATSYKIFVDKDNDGEYDFSDGELLEEKDLGEIQIIPWYYGSSWLTTPDLAIVFKPPNPDVVVSRGGVNNEYNEYRVRVEFPGGTFKDVMINTAGLIYIDE